MPDHLLDGQARCERIAELAPAGAGVERRKIGADRVEHRETRQGRGQLGELIVRRMAGQYAEHSRDFLHAQHVEIGNSARFVDRPGEVHVALRIASPLDIPANQSHLQISVGHCRSSTISPLPHVCQESAGV